jgi:hypothetical protein
MLSLYLYAVTGVFVHYVVSLSLHIVVFRQGLCSLCVVCSLVTV